MKQKQATALPPLHEADEALLTRVEMMLTHAQAVGAFDGKAIPSCSKESVASLLFDVRWRLTNKAGRPAPSTTIRRRHSASGRVRCDICAPLRCSQAK